MNGDRFRYDNTTSKECNNLMSGLEENKLTGFLWNQMKPFIRGKILFTPDTPAVRRLLANVNETFEPIETIRRFAETWINNYSEPVRNFVLKEDNQLIIKQQFTKDTFTELNYPTLINLLLSNNVTRALNEQGNSPLVEEDELRRRLNEYFAGNFSEKWEETLDQVDHFMNLTAVYLSCFDFNKFVAMPDEHQLEVDGIRLISENKLWAGLVFENAAREGRDAEKLPPYVKYKIRVDSDKVDATRYLEDRLNRPGPRRRPGIDLKYLYFGFAYLQGKRHY